MSMFHISGVLLFANKDLIIMSCFSLLHMIQQGFIFDHYVEIWKNFLFDENTFAIREIWDYNQL